MIAPVGRGLGLALALFALGQISPGLASSALIDFTHWTLVLQGPKANYTLFGDLVTAK
jgi:hypothetical protein